MFGSYLGIGFEHILDINAYDHVLFIVALCVVYPIKEWKKVLILITAFTIGHSISLALSVLDIVTIKASFIELLIPITIILTALANMFSSKVHHKSSYLIALIFGGIHGFGFSNYLKAIMGSEDSIVVPLLAFNVGVEISQIIVVIITLAVSYVITGILKLKSDWWIKIVSTIVLVVAIRLLSNILFS